MKALSPVPVVLGLLVGVQSAAAGDPGTTRGIIDIGKPKRPADAVTLVGPDGYHLIPEGKAPTKWVFADGILTASPGWDSVLTRESYRDFRMHVEFNVNEVKDAKDFEANGNSGIYIQNRYEIQIHNSFGVPEADYKTSHCGSIYRRKKPDRLVCKPAGEWQSFDIVFRAAHFDGGKKTANARITNPHPQQRCCSIAVYWGAPFSKQTKAHKSLPTSPMIYYSLSKATNLAKKNQSQQTKP